MSFRAILLCYPVTHLISHVDEEVVYLTVVGERLVTTAEHPFYTGEGVWVEAGDLEPGDTIRTATWTTGQVEAVTIATDPQPMYNFTVATAHTYFVGDGEWLVHNACGRSETFVRYGNAVEAEASIANKGLVPRPGHERQPKWIGEVGSVDHTTLGKTKNYTHEMTIQAQPGTRQWLKQYEIKPSNEPGRYAIPAKQLDAFNKRITNITARKIR